MMIRSSIVATTALALAVLGLWQRVWVVGFLRAMWIPLRIKYLFRAVSRRGCAAPRVPTEESPEAVLERYRKAVARKMEVDRRVAEREAARADRS